MLALGLRSEPGSGHETGPGPECQLNCTPDIYVEVEACYKVVTYEIGGIGIRHKACVVSDTNDKPQVATCDEDCPVADCQNENSEWMEWNPCSKSCGNGIKERRRRLKAYCYKVDSTSCNKGPYTYDVC